MKKWQYWTGCCQPGAHSQILDDLGSQGWELVTATMVAARTSPLSPEQIPALLMIFKRPAEQSGLVGATETRLSAPVPHTGEWGPGDHMAVSTNGDGP